jgi:hypothetical protein
MLAAIEQTGIATIFHALADRYRLGNQASGWQELDEHDGPNNNRFASYQLTINSDDGRPQYRSFSGSPCQTGCRANSDA